MIPLTFPSAKELELQTSSQQSLFVRTNVATRKIHSYSDFLSPSAVAVVAAPARQLGRTPSHRRAWCAVLGRLGLGAHHGDVSRRFSLLERRGSPSCNQPTRKTVALAHPAGGKDFSREGRQQCLHRERVLFHSGMVKILLV